MKNAEGCIVEIIGEKNLDHFFVGTQDTDMRKKFQESVNANSKDCSKMVIALDNKTQATIARLEALENDYTGMETVEAVEDDEASLEDDVYIQKKQKDTKRKTLQVKALENARKAPRNFLELLHEV
ncbi:hypothetical protein OIU77_015207 [Salix suchowensis]|uniref:Uncharacterized protein n=1 Tax=Salix suchowensis TaxID=1278906 RepID=A0ABQ8ZRY5_9ROSI|nr:hypothetical protein OIU77_015207 [Salix suchowensis]